MSGRAPSNVRSTTAPAARLASARARFHPRRALQRTLCARAWTTAEIVFVVVVCLALALWVAFAVALQHRDQVNTWIDVLAAAIIFSLWAFGQGAWSVVVAQERKVRVHREEELEMARQRGREEMRRELGVGEEV